MLSAELHQTHLPVAARLTKRVVAVILAQVHKATGMDGELSIVFLPEKEMRQLNKMYRQKDKVTDVLSFELPLGDILICYPQAKRQAAERGHTVKQEVVDLIIHGALHALGYDHEKPKDAKIMLPLQQKIYDAVAPR